MCCETVTHDNHDLLWNALKLDSIKLVDIINIYMYVSAISSTKDLDLNHNCTFQLNSHIIKYQSDY